MAASNRRGNQPMPATDLDAGTLTASTKIQFGLLIVLGGALVGGAFTSGKVIQRLDTMSEQHTKRDESFERFKIEQASKFEAIDDRLRATATREDVRELTRSAVKDAVGTEMADVWRRIGALESKIATGEKPTGGG